MNEFNKELCKYVRDNIDKTLAQHSETIEKLNECTIKLTEILSAREEKNKDFEKRIKHLEHKPVKIFDTILISGICSLITSIITLIITR